MLPIILANRWLPAFAVPALGNPVKFGHDAVQLQYPFGDAVGDLRWDGRLIVSRKPALCFEHSQPLCQCLGRDCSKAPPEFAESLRAFHVKPVKKEQSPRARQDAEQLCERLVGAVALGSFSACHSFLKQSNFTIRTYFTV